MARIARVIAVDVPHHVTQRGNGRQFILPTDADRRVYLDLLRHYSELYRTQLVGYCLMSNHVHLIVVPKREDSLALTFKNAHGRYATHWNAGRHSSGHAWQGRFFSCPLDEEHLWAALRYVELNPVRAGMVSRADEYVWSSAAAHCGVQAGEEWMDMEVWRSGWDAPSWREFLAGGTPESEAEAVRENTHTGRPLGSQDFVDRLGRELHRQLAPQSGGRPPKAKEDQRQTSLIFARD